MQVADCLILSRLDDAGLLHALSRRLPEDVRPRSVKTVDDSFHSQHKALNKTYRYVLDHSSHADPFLRRYSAHVPSPLDMEAVQAAVLQLPGKRDWSGFASVAAPPENRWRNLTEAVMIRESPVKTVFRFTADGFLNHMVRNIVGALLEIGKGRFGIDRIVEILSTGDRYLAGEIAPARGLTLEKVVYDSTEG
jgi:tRNA pseudouridine38-40 synthase